MLLLKIEILLGIQWQVFYDWGIVAERRYVLALGFNPRSIIKRSLKSRRGCEFLGLAFRCLGNAVRSTGFSRNFRVSIWLDSA